MVVDKTDVTCYHSDNCTRSRTSSIRGGTINTLEIASIVIGVALIPVAVFAAYKIKTTSPLSEHSNGAIMSFMFFPSLILIFLPFAINSTNARSDQALREIRQAHANWQHVSVDYANKIVYWEQNGKFCEAPLQNPDDRFQISTNPRDTKCTL